VCSTFPLGENVTIKGVCHPGFGGVPAPYRSTDPLRLPVVRGSMVAITVGVRVLVNVRVDVGVVVRVGVGVDVPPVIAVAVRVGVGVGSRVTLLPMPVE
jgi:hypothetical protein